MVNLTKIATLIVALSIIVQAASLKATVNTIEVEKGNPVTLRIKAVGDEIVFPSIHDVAGAKVLGTSTNSSRNMTIINGKVASEVSQTKIIEFLPESNLTIPSYEVKIEGKAYHTKPIKITLSTSHTSVAQGNARFALEMKANKKELYVGEPFVLTVYFALRRDVQLSQEIGYEQPDFTHFVSSATPEQKAYIKGDYQIQEVRYILTPQEEGNFTIAPARAKVGVADGSRRDIFGMSYGTKWYQKASNALNINVHPLGVDASMVGEFTLNATLDTHKAKANTPVNLTVTIEGEGSLENFEYPPYHIDGVTVYGDDAKVETSIKNGKLFSHYTKTFAFIADENFSIPSREFQVFNPKRKQQSTLEVPAYSVEVLPSHESLPSQTTPKGVVQSNAPTPLEATPTKVVEKRVEVATVAWWMLALAFGAGMLFLWLLQKLPTLKRTPSPFKEDEALKILYAHMSEDATVEAMVRKLYAKKNGDSSVTIDKKELRAMVERFR